MDIILDYITAFGTIVAAASIIFAFVLYRVQKRDEYLSKVRDSLQLLSNDMAELDSLLNFELAYELASSLVYSKSTQYCLHRIFEICNESIVNKKKEEETKTQIKNALGVFGVSFQDTIVSKYTNLISDIKQASTIYYPDYKGLFRFSKACTTLMRNVFLNYKKLLLSEDLLSRLIYGELVESAEPWDRYDHFQKTLLDHLISVVELGRIKRSQKDVDCLLELVEIVYSSHIELSAKEWHKLAKNTKKIALKPYDTITTVTDDLREAEKCFADIMSHESSIKYAELVKTIEIANSSDGNIPNFV